VASVHLLSAAPAGPGAHRKAHLDLDLMRAAARADRFGVHRVVDDPAEADVNLFVETSWLAGYYFERVRSHPVYRKFRSKCYLFSSTDKVIPFLPGIYASIERRWCWPAWARSGFYPTIREEGALTYEPGDSPSRLFSFVGAANAHPVRREIMELDRSDAALIDSHADATALRQGERSELSADDFRARYVESIRDSAFVLCPRGGGTATFRLFEAMLLGRVPVIISDQWVAPEGPDWERFSLRVAEGDVGSVPALLESRAGEAFEMGKAAREAWLDWFSLDSAFHRTVGWCLDLGQLASRRSGLRRYMPYLQMLRPYHAARAVAKRLGHGRGADA
jgi:hypothetical protein